MISRDIVNEEECMDGYRALGYEVIKQAVRDYRKLLRLKEKCLKLNELTYLSDKIKQIEDFFYSRLFASITSIDPDWFIKKLREENYKWV